MIKCSIPSITVKEKEFVLDAIAAKDIGVGSYVGKFENAWADYNKMAYGVACNSGTNAIYLALKALGIGKGDEVLVPSYTMIATAWAVSYTGATPVFIDCADDLNIDVDLLEEAIGKKTKAIIPVHIYGRQCDMVEINRIARRHQLYVVEDMAEAHGIQPDSDIACYSFYGNKILTTGEGGMCLTNSKYWAEEMRLYANMYFDKDRTMLHPKMGHNFRMTNIQAAIGYAQVTRIDEILDKRDKIQFMYEEYLNHRYIMPIRNVVWMYDINCGNKQEEIKQALLKEGIESRYGFKPMERQPQYFDKRYEKLNSHKWSKRILYLPTYPGITEKEIEKISNIVNSIK
jgi:dTDP-4-amino-4,6-dideoxygalactose transaminase